MKTLAKLEPIRLYVYGIIGPVVAAIIGFGLYDREKTLWVAGILMAVLTVPAAEAARNRVIPVEKTVLTGNIANDVRAQFDQGIGMLQAQVTAALPGLIRPVITRSVDQAIVDSQMPTESVPSGKVDYIPAADAAPENPYA